MSRRIPAPILVAVATMLLGSVPAESSSVVVPRSEVRFQPLNPARGDAGPQAGVLWGDIAEDVPTGTIIVFKDGFSSPPHIHNVTYRAVVISGEVHNDDPKAEPLWMGPGSFWTQPAGESHITSAAGGSRAVAFLEILQGPYLVRPPEKAFDNGERPINLEARNIVWMDSSDVSWIDLPETSRHADGPKLAFLWGSPMNGERNATFLRIPAGFSGELRGAKVWLRAVVIQGKVRHGSSRSEIKALEPGSYFGSKDGAAQKVACAGSEECLLYVSTEGRYRFVEVPTPAKR